MLSKQKRFYVYALLDPRKPGPFFYGHWKFSHEPFYLGKGSGRRAFNHVTGSAGNGHSVNKVKAIRKSGLEPEVLIKRASLTEKQALLLEMKLIGLVGRVDLKTGPLCNWSNGGEQMRGVVKDEAYRRKISKGQLRRFSDPNEVDRVRTRMIDWVKANPEQHEINAEIRRKTLTSENHKVYISKVMKDSHRRNPSVKVRQTTSRKATMKANPQIAIGISKSLGGKGVRVYDYSTGKFLSTYPTQHEASRSFGCGLGNINSVLYGRRNHTGGYTFKFASS